MMHNTLDVKKKVNMTFTFDLTSRAFFGISDPVSEIVGQTLKLADAFLILS
jgi:hypothetical protein